MLCWIGLHFLVWIALCCVGLDCVGLHWTGFDLVVCDKACPDCVCFVAFSVHLLALAKPQQFHNDQVMHSKSKVEHRKRKTVLIAWTPTLGPLPQLVQATASRAASERSTKKAKRPRNGAKVIGGPSLQARVQESVTPGDNC